MHWRPLLGFFVLGLIVNASQIEFAPPLAPKQGQRLLYKQQFHFNVNGLKIERSGVMELQYQAVQGGRVQSVCTSSIDRLVVDGEKLTVSDSIKYSETTEKGETKEIRSDDLDATDLRLMALSCFEPGPVAAGESKLHREFKSSKFRPMPVSHDYAFLGNERVMGVLCKKFSIAAKETSGPSPISCQSTVWINTSDGTLCKATGAYQNVPFDSEEAGGYVLEFFVEWVP